MVFTKKGQGETRRCHQCEHCLAKRKLPCLNLKVVADPDDAKAAELTPASVAEFLGSQNELPNNFMLRKPYINISDPKHRKAYVQQAGYLLKSLTQALYGESWQQLLELGALSAVGKQAILGQNAPEAKALKVINNVVERANQLQGQNNRGSRRQVERELVPLTAEFSHKEVVVSILNLCYCFN